MARKTKDDAIPNRLIDVGLRDPFIRGIAGLVVVAAAASYAISALGSGTKAVITLALSLAFGVVLVVLRTLIKNVDSPFVRTICFAASGIIMFVFLAFAVLLIPAAIICWPHPYAQLLSLPSCASTTVVEPQLGAAIRRHLIEVQQVKEILQHLGMYGGVINNETDDAYFKAVANFQSSQNITQDGLVGGETFTKLRAAWPEYFDQKKSKSK